MAGLTHLDTLLENTDGDNISAGRLALLLVLAAFVLGTAIVWYYYF